MKKTHRNTKKLLKYLKDNSIVIDEQIQIKIELLDSLFADYDKADADIKNNGLTTYTNNGKTLGINPSFKVKEKVCILIIKLLKEIGIIVKDTVINIKDESDEYIESLLR